MIIRPTLLASAIAMVSSAAFAQEYPVTVTDDRPAEVTLESEPQRVVTLANFATDMAAALGIQPIGVTTYTGERPIYLGDAAMYGEDLGDLTAPNLELMATLNPDLVIGMLRYNGPYSEDIEEFSQFLAYQSNTIDQSLNIVEHLGQALGHKDEAQAMNASYLALYDEVTSKLEKQGPSFLFIWYFQDTMYAYKEGLMPAEALTRIGGVNLAGPGGIEPENAFAILEPEQLLEMDPEVLFVFASHGGAVKYSPLFDRLQAVKNDRAYLVGYQFSQSAGPIARELVVREAAYLMHPDIFDMPDMVDAARARRLEFDR